MESLSGWWAALTPSLKIYWALAIPASILFVGQMIISLVSGDTDHTVDVDVESDHGIGFQFLTLKNMAAFFTIFSWTGIIGTSLGWNAGTTLFVSTISGLAMVGIMAAVMFMMMKLNSSGTMKIAEAIGKSGQVYLTIPAKRSSSGQIQLVVGGLLRTLDAVTDDDAQIATGSHARVAAILDNNVLLVSAI